MFQAGDWVVKDGDTTGQKFDQVFPGEYTDGYLIRPKQITAVHGAPNFYEFDQNKSYQIALPEGVRKATTKEIKKEKLKRSFS